MQGFSKAVFPKECCVIPNRKMCQVGQLGHVNNKGGTALKETGSLCAHLCSELIFFLRHPFGTVNLFTAVSWMIAVRELAQEKQLYFSTC